MARATILVVEGPEVLHGAAAPSGNEQVGHPAARSHQAMAAQSSSRGTPPPVPAPAAPAPRAMRPASPQVSRSISRTAAPAGRGNEGDFSGTSAGWASCGPGQTGPLLVELLLQLFKGHMEIPHAVGGQAHYSRADTARPVERPIPGRRRPPSCRFPDGSAGRWPPARNMTQRMAPSASFREK